MDYISAKEAAGKWGVTQRRVEALCANAQVRGAKRFGSMWLIPKDAQKPIDGRTKAARKGKNPMQYKIRLSVESIIEMVNGTMAMEHAPLTNEDRGRLRSILRGEVTADDMVRELVAKHRRGADAGRLHI